MGLKFFSKFPQRKVFTIFKEPLSKILKVPNLKNLAGDIFLVNYLISQKIDAEKIAFTQEFIHKNDYITKVNWNVYYAVKSNL